MLKSISQKNFDKGLITDLEPQSVPRGGASNSKNWLHLGDRIELRRGSRIIGEEQSGTGRITGLHVGYRSDGTQVLFMSYGSKLFYYDRATELFVEIGTNLFASADDEDISFANYESLAGAQVWISSPNTGLWKIMTANPGSVVDQYDASKNFKGKISIDDNRMFLWGRTQDKTAPYLSYIDSANYTTVSGEAIAGTGTVFSGTLAFKAGGAKRTCFGVTITGNTGEIFTDDYNGNLSSPAGGTGTINYATGAYSVTFIASQASVTADYQWENSTDQGIADFTKSATRLAGEGAVFRQDAGGGALQSIKNYDGTQYCIHELKTWELNITSDDTNATNTVFRENVGIRNWRGAVATGDGIYFVDDRNKTKTRIRLLTLDASSTKKIPVDKSNALDLSSYSFDLCAGHEWGDYILFFAREDSSLHNNVLFAYNKVWNLWDKLDIFGSCAVTYDGVLYVGDSVSDNVYEVFSGFDDNDSAIDNFWEGNSDQLDLPTLKKVKKLWIKGKIQSGQTIDVYLNPDNSGFVKYGEISGTGGYVDSGNAISIGAVTIGSKEVGGGSTAFAYEYFREIKIRTDKFESIIPKFQATGLGYASVSEIVYQDIRGKVHKIPLKYRV